MVKEDELTSTTNANSTDDGSIAHLTLVKKQFLGKYAISSEEFTPEMVWILDDAIFLSFTNPDLHSCF